jgi:K+-transporting ATPase KdpF subunit
MTPLEWTSLVVAIALGIYLLVALLAPERFQ